MPDHLDRSAEPSVGVLLFVAYRAMEARVLEAVVEAGFEDITLAQARVFQRIGPRGAAAAPVAAAALAEVEAEWTAHLGATAMSQLRRALVRLREITDPFR